MAVLLNIQVFWGMAVCQTSISQSFEGFIQGQAVQEE
jgi:hypothetical protein